MGTLDGHCRFEDRFESNKNNTLAHWWPCDSFAIKDIITEFIAHQTGLSIWGWIAKELTWNQLRAVSMSKVISLRDINKSVTNVNTLFAQRTLVRIFLAGCIAGIIVFVERQSKRDCSRLKVTTGNFQFFIMSKIRFFCSQRHQYVKRRAGEKLNNFCFPWFKAKVALTWSGCGFYLMI